MRVELEEDESRANRLTKAAQKMAINFVDLVVIGLVLCQPIGLLYYGFFLLALILIFSVLASQAEAIVVL